MTITAIQGFDLPKKKRKKPLLRFISLRWIPLRVLASWTYVESGDEDVFVSRLPVYCLVSASYPSIAEAPEARPFFGQFLYCRGGPWLRSVRRDVRAVVGLRVRSGR